jgi:NAD-dependent SIR2 family protein deacetylase
MAFCEPHEGYNGLKNIIKNKNEHSDSRLKDNWHIYHQGIDHFYQLMDFDEKKICQPKGSLFRWQCTNCRKMLGIEDLLKMGNGEMPIFEIDEIQGAALKMVMCRKCRSEYRPNI